MESQVCQQRHQDERRRQGPRNKWLLQWSPESGSKRDRLWQQLPSDAVLHTKDYRWKSYREEEPTASSKSAGKGKQEKEKLTDRAYRLRNQWYAREKLRDFVDSVLKAAPAGAFSFPSRSHRTATCHFTAYHITPLSLHFLIAPHPVSASPFLSTPQHASLTQSSPPTSASVDRRADGVGQPTGGSVRGRMAGSGWRVFQVAELDYGLIDRVGLSVWRVALSLGWWTGS